MSDPSVQTQVQPPATAREAKAQAKAAKAYAKAQRPFYKKKRFIIPAALVVLIIILVAANGGSSNNNSVSPGTSASAKLYPNRPDAQDKDHEAAIGSGADLRGRTATVTAATFQPSVSQFENDGYIVADVTILNRNSDAQPYNIFDWRVQTPNGQVLDPAIVTTPGQLGSGDLVGKGTVSGKVVFKVGADTHGTFYVIYKPDAFASDRGIWGLTVP